jgi:transcriptional regulator with XRE-family HTH domain
MSPDGTILNEQLCKRFLLTQEASGLHKSEFARRAGLSPSQLANIAKYRNPPSHEAIERAAREFGLTSDWFYFGSRVGFRDPKMADQLRNLGSK